MCTSYSTQYGDRTEGEGGREGRIGQNIWALFVRGN